MMVDRLYLPFKSLREYQDRGMLKWMGFFLSEHSSLLLKEAGKKDWTSDLTRAERLLYLSQVYANQFPVVFKIREGQEVSYFRGQVSSLEKGQVLLKGEQNYVRVLIDDILWIGEEKDDGEIV